MKSKSKTEAVKTVFSLTKLTAHKSFEMITILLPIQDFKAKYVEDGILQNV